MIAAERLPHLFTALRQPGEAPTRTQTGLGLALTRRLVEAMDGDRFASYLEIPPLSG